MTKEDIEILNDGEFESAEDSLQTVPGQRRDYRELLRATENLLTENTELRRQLKAKTFISYLMVALVILVVVIAAITFAVGTPT